MGEEMEQINLTIPKSMKEWLDEHKEINRSQLFRDAVTNKRYRKENKISPLTLFAVSMAPLFGITLIIIGITPVPMETSIRAFLPLLGGIMAIGASITYIVERKRIKQEV